MKAILSVIALSIFATTLSGCVVTNAYHPDCVATAEGVYCPQPVTYLQWAPNTQACGCWQAVGPQPVAYYRWAQCQPYSPCHHSCYHSCYHHSYNRCSCQH